MTAVKVINEYIEFDTSSYTFRVPISDNINERYTYYFFLVHVYIIRIKQELKQYIFLLMN